MPASFNPPPNWPKPPKGWTPEPGWQPDPSWGPAPEGWNFWTDDADGGGTAHGTSAEGSASGATDASAGRTSHEAGQQGSPVHEAPTMPLSQNQASSWQDGSGSGSGWGSAQGSDRSGSDHRRADDQTTGYGGTGYGSTGEDRHDGRSREAITGTAALGGASAGAAGSAGAGTGNYGGTGGSGGGWGGGNGSNGSGWGSNGSGDDGGRKKGFFASAAGIVTMILALLVVAVVLVLFLTGVLGGKHDDKKDASDNQHTSAPATSGASSESSSAAPTESVFETSSSSASAGSSSSSEGSGSAPSVMGYDDLTPVKSFSGSGDKDLDLSGLDKSIRYTMTYQYEGDGSFIVDEKSSDPGISLNFSEFGSSAGSLWLNQDAKDTSDSLTGLKVQDSDSGHWTIKIYKEATGLKGNKGTVQGHGTYAMGYTGSARTLSLKNTGSGTTQLRVNEDKSGNMVDAVSVDAGSTESIDLPAGKDVTIQVKTESYDQDWSLQFK